MDKQKKPTYIFPKSIANVMESIDQRTQYEASMLSMVFMMFGVALSAFYALRYLNFQTWFKVVTFINAVFAILFMFAYLVTTYQQYSSHMNFLDMQKALTVLNNEKEVENGKEH